MNQLTFPQIADLTDMQARKYLEALRWDNGVFCPHCGIEGAYKLIPKESSKRPVRDGVWKCNNKYCRKQFTATVGTIMQGSHISIKKWLMAIALLCSSKKGMSSHQLHRMLGVTYKTAWFMSHRIRLAMEIDISQDRLSGIIEIDDGFIGGKEHGMHKKNKSRFVVLIERNGRAKSIVTDRVTSENIHKILSKNIKKKSTLYTDGAFAYVKPGRKFKKHIAIIGYKHGCGEDGSIHINHADNYMGILKRGITGVYQHVSRQHLHRYLSEFDFRYSLRDVPDKNRTTSAIQGIVGKRMVYKANGTK